jgi:predicted NUDIX family phosphoesterase
MEFIFVVKREVVKDIIPEKGLVFLKKEEIEKIVDEGFFIERPHAETDSSFKQIIPYVVIKRDDELFLFKRLKGGGEARLHNLHSIGVGGHINPIEIEDGKNKGFSIVTGGASRELKEEVDLDYSDDFEVIGLLNDDTNEVGSVHLGVVLSVTIPSDMDLQVAEKEVLSGEFVKIREISELIESKEFESWSSMIVKEKFNS